jgi:hypothetical protein
MSNVVELAGPAKSQQRFGFLGRQSVRQGSPQSIRYIALPQFSARARGYRVSVGSVVGRLRQLAERETLHALFA